MLFQNLDLQNRQITFTSSRYYRCDDGAWIPSVTTLLEAYPKSAQFLNWLKETGQNAEEIRDAAGRRGYIVHQMTEDYDAGLELTLLNEEGYPQYQLDEWGMFERYVEFTKRFSPKHLLIEQNFISPELGYAGTIDRVSIINGKYTLLDIKTSNAVYPSYWLQLAAYHRLYNEMLQKTRESGKFCEFGIIDQIGILWLNAKTRTEGKKDAMQGNGWQLLVKPFWGKEIELFNATKALWLAEHGDEKPKQFSYQLSHKK